MKKTIVLLLCLFVMNLAEASTKIDYTVEEEYGKLKEMQLEPFINSQRYELKENSYLNDIFSNIIQYNNLPTKKEGRYLDKILMIVDYQNQAEFGGMAIGGGIVLQEETAMKDYLSRGYVNPKKDVRAENENKTYIRKNNLGGVYNTSVLASEISHEVGHWIENDMSKASTTIEEDKQLELTADLWGTKLLGNTPTMSYGGTLMGIRYFGEDGEFSDYEDEKEAHPSSWKRFSIVVDNIEKWSKNQLKIAKKDGNHHFVVKGTAIDLKNVHSQVEANSYSSALEVETPAHNLYVAGNVAYCLENDLWKKENIFIHPVKEFFKQYGYEGEGSVIVTKYRYGYKVIDMTDITPSRLESLKNGDSAKSEKEMEYSKLFSTLD